MSHLKLADRRVDFEGLHSDSENPGECLRLSELGDPDGTRMVDIMESKAEVPDNLLESAETRERVKDVVDSMPALYREVLQLNYFQKMSYQQIAEVLGVPLGTVKSRLHAAVATFAESWKTADARSLRTSSANKESKA